MLVPITYLPVYNYYTKIIVDNIFLLIFILRTFFFAEFYKFGNLCLKKIIKKKKSSTIVIYN